MIISTELTFEMLPNSLRSMRDKPVMDNHFILYGVFNDCTVSYTDYANG